MRLNPSFNPQLRPKRPVCANNRGLELETTAFGAPAGDPVLDALGEGEEQKRLRGGAVGAFRAVCLGAALSHLLLWLLLSVH